MITYLTFSAICMALLLLFYHAVLEKEKMFHLNRGYLIFSLIFSLVIPFIPVGWADTMLPWFQGLQASEVRPFQFLSPFNAGLAQPPTGAHGNVMPAQIENKLLSFDFLTRLVLIGYFSVTAILSVRLLRIIKIIRMKAKRYPFRFFKNCKVILLDKRVVPHTFMSTIFVNREQYQNGKIENKILLHEYTHAKQKHTVDILFVELLKLVFWFNPMLYFYKKAMLLNHEFLADEAVLASGTSVPEYQKLLLNTLLAQPVSGLTNNFNDPIAKKRFHMMTQTTSGLRSFLKYTALLPLFVLLGAFLGCESTSVEHKASDDTITITILDSEWVKLNGQKMRVSKLEEDLAQFPQGSETDFQLSIDPNAPMGVVWDVQQLINKNNRSRNARSSMKVVEIKVDDAETIRLQDEKVTLQELYKRLVELNATYDLIINFSTGAEGSPALIADIQKVVRNSGTLRINYSYTGNAGRN